MPLFPRYVYILMPMDKVSLANQMALSFDSVGGARTFDPENGVSPTGEKPYTHSQCATALEEATYKNLSQIREVYFPESRMEECSPETAIAKREEILAEEGLRLPIEDGAV